MKKVQLVGPFICAFFLFSSCSRNVGDERSMEGYWRGFYQFKTEVTKGQQSQNLFGKDPISIYCKIEQTGDVFIGQYSTKFDADAFKREVPTNSRKVEGVVSGRSAIIRFHNTTENGFYTPMEAKVLLSNGEVSGEWKMEYEYNGSLYSGVIKLTRY